MTSHGMSEEAWELAAIERLAETDFWEPLTGHDIAPGSGLRETWADPVVRPWVMEALGRLNKDVPTQHLQQALADILSTTSQDAITENRRMHDILVHGYRGLTYTDGDGHEVTPTIWLLSPHADENDYHAVTQVTVRAGDHQRRFDIVLYVNGLPLVIIELKKAGSEKADVSAAYAQLATYVRELPMAFRFCVLTVISDGVVARYGTPFTPLNHFAPWNVDDIGSPLTAYEIRLSLVGSEMCIRDSSSDRAGGRPPAPLRHRPLRQRPALGHHRAEAVSYTHLTLPTSDLV